MVGWIVEPRVAFRHQKRARGTYLRPPFFVCVFIGSDWWSGRTFDPFLLLRLTP